MGPVDNFSPVTGPACSACDEAYCCRCHTQRDLRVCVLGSGAKIAELNEMPFGRLSHVGPLNHVPDGFQTSPWEWALLGGRVSTL